MELSIHFYSKQELAIQIDSTNGNPYTTKESNDLYLFSHYALRQFSNLGNRPEAVALALLLTSTSSGKESSKDLAKDEYEYPNSYAFHLLMGLENVHFNIDFRVLRDYLMSSLPRIVAFHGKGEKIFTMTLPPVQLQLKGFGILGFQITYYSFNSVISLFRYFAKNHITDDVFLGHLSQVATLCGRAYLSNKVHLGDQSLQVKAILKDIVEQ